MGSVFGRKSVPGQVSAEINNRGTKAGLLWNAKRFPWIRVTSLCSGCTDNRYIALGDPGQSLYEDNYVRPYPVVTQVQVKKQGELGTTKKAIVDITAFSDEQLVELQKCFFIPAMGVRVQWGWNVDSFGNIAEPLVFDRSMSNPKAICKMNNHASSHTNYNGLQGIVGNFSYKLTANNTWECSMEIIAASEAVAGSSVATHNCPQCAREYTNEENGESKKAVENKSDLYTFFHDLFENFETATPKYKSAFGGAPTIIQGNYMGVTRDDKGGDDSSWYEGGIIGSVIGNDPDATEAYISFATLEAAINTLCLPTKGGKHTVGKIQSKNTYITYHPSLESTDPRVCVIPGTNYWSNIVSLKGWANPAIASDGGTQRVLLDNILINAVFLMLEIDSVEKSGDAKLTTFLQNVLRKINAACGDLWEFEVVSSEENCADANEVPVISIIDTKIYDPAPAYEVPTLAIGDKASVVRDLTLNMKMNENMKTQAVYAGGTKSTAKTDGGGNCGANAFEEGFGIGSSKYNLAAPPPSDTKKCPCEGAAPNEKQKSFDELMMDMSKEVTDSSTSAARTALMDKYNPKNGDQHCDGMIVPFEFGFTTDGIGGFSFGQMVSSDRIPSAVKKSFEWQVTTVEHTVTPNDWTTTVNTVMRFKKR